MKKFEIKILIVLLAFLQVKKLKKNLFIASLHDMLFSLMKSQSIDSYRFVSSEFAQLLHKLQIAMVYA